MKLTGLFSEAKSSGVYRLDTAFELSRLETLATEHEYTLILIDGNRISNKATFLDEFEQALSTPPEEAEHGKNWDAFLDILEVPYWIQSKAIIIVYRDFRKFRAENEAHFNMALDIFQHATKFHNKRAHHPQIAPLFILLQGDTSAPLSLDWLE